MLRKWLALNSLGAGLVASFGGMGQENASEAAEALPQHGSQASSAEGVLPSLEAAISSELQNRVTPPAYGFTELAKALAKHGRSPQGAGAEKFKDLVRAIVDLEVKQKSQSYGGLR